jgi:HK97 family phage major capsid protein
MNMYRFLKDYDGQYKTGDVAEIDATLAEVLVKAGVVEVHDPATEEAEMKRLGELQDTVKNAVRSEITKALADTKVGNDLRVMVEVTQAEEDKSFESFGHQMVAIAKAQTPGASEKDVDPRLKSTKAISGMNETIGSEGGYLVQSQFSDAMITRAFGQSVLAPACSNVTIGAGANALHWNEREDYDQQDSARNVQVYWTAEAGEATAAKGALKRQSMGLENLRGLYYATEESLEDAPSLGMMMNSWFQEEYSFKIDQAILRGDGVQKPLGVLNSSCLVTQAKESGQTADTINAANVAKMYSRMWAPSISNAAWYINQEALPQIMLMTLTTSGIEYPIWTPPSTGLTGAPGGLLMGRPIRFLDQCSTLGDKGDIFFMDMSKYRLITKGGLKQDARIHVRFIYHETTFRFTLRINGQAVWSSVVTPSQATTHTRSPFVTLAARA